MAWSLPSTAILGHLCQKLNRLKKLDESAREMPLQCHLTTLNLTLLGVGALVGFELYVLTGIVAKEMAGPAVTVSFSVAAVASLLAALCYAELAAGGPCGGSAYLYTYVSMGELWAFLVGWNVLFQSLIAGTAGARACSGYLNAIFSHRIRSFTEAHVGSWQVPFLSQYPDFLAAGIALLGSVFISYGARVSSCLDYTSSGINLVVILFIIIVGCVLAHPHNWSAEEGGFVPFGFSGIMAGAATCCYAFVGFEDIAASSKEARNPKQAVPMAIAISLGLVAVAYVLVSTVLTLMVPWHSLDPYLALSDAFYQRGYSWVAFIVAAGSICAMTTVLLFDLFSLPRIIHAMATDGLFFQVFAQENSWTQVPMVGILVFGVLMAFLALLVDLEALVQFLSIGTLWAYNIVATSIIVLRFLKSPEPRQLRPALRPYLGFLGGSRSGAAVAWSLGVLVASAITLDCVLAFGDSALHLPLWGYTLLLLLSSVTFLLSLLVLGAHQQQCQQDTFQVPLVPLMPALSILLNVFLTLHLSSLAWLRFSIWLLIGLVVYFGYGIRHSKENQREQPGLTAPRGSLEETMHGLQPPSQTPAQKPGHMEQPASP